MGHAIRFVGADSDFIYFVAASASRKGLEHSVSVSKRDGIITCTCEDAMYRTKFGDVMDLNHPWKCRHVSRLCHTLGAVLAPEPPSESVSRASFLAGAGSDGDALSKTGGEG